MLVFIVTFIISSLIFEYCIYEFERQMKRQKYGIHPMLMPKMDEVDYMKGKEFDEFVLTLFENTGYRVELTPTNQGYGADLILYKDKLKFAVQAKRYKNPVGVKAVEEVLRSMKFHQANKAMILTNSTFTVSAYELARSKSVVLWDRKKLIKLMRRATRKVYY